MNKNENWNNFSLGKWRESVDVRHFIQENYVEYRGNDNFLTPSTEKTMLVWKKLTELFVIEKEKGILEGETKFPQSITTYGPGYIDQENEVIVGLQTDKPLKRGIYPKGGLRTVENALHAYGYEIDPLTKEIFSKYRKTHNDGVFSVYTDEMKGARSSGIITGLPDSYGRGRIIGDYRRVALYGTTFLIEDKKEQIITKDFCEITDEVIRVREELSEQLKSLYEFEKMCLSYGFNVKEPAATAKEAVQFLYFAYLAATKDQDGAAMSIGRVSTFLDIYIERDLKRGIINESEAQELIDQLVIKLRIIRFLRTPDYNTLFSGDPTWVTESIGGMGTDGRSLVTKNSFRILHTLYNLGPAPEPNLTVLWSKNLPIDFKNFCSKVSVDTSSIQYENDDLMRPEYGDDYGIACCVSPMKIGKGMQFFGARVNLPKALLYAINGGKDEKSGKQVAPEYGAITSDILNYDEVYEKFDTVMKWLSGVYVNSLKMIHYMHDKYSYESFEMALHDLEIDRTQATGIAGISIVVDSLIAIKNAKVKVIRDENGLAIDYEIIGSYVPFGNNNEETDELAIKLVKRFMQHIRSHTTYRDSRATQSLLTITSNVVYGKKTGNTPCGRRAGAPFSPGANPMNGRDTKGALASLLSVAKLPFEDSNDGISYTFAIAPAALGKTLEDRVVNLTALLDGYFTPNGGQHLNVNVFDRELLEDAMKNPENYPQLTIRVSGYAVNFTKLTTEQQLDVLSRTITSRI
ncbi:MAG: formate C-acetyltransferase [Fusobacteriaceae bacterium]